MCACKCGEMCACACTSELLFLPAVELLPVCVCFTRVLCVSAVGGSLCGRSHQRPVSVCVSLEQVLSLADSWTCKRESSSRVLQSGQRPQVSEQCWAAMAGLEWCWAGVAAEGIRALCSLPPLTSNTIKLWADKIRRDCWAFMTYRIELFRLFARKEV